MIPAHLKKLRAAGRRASRAHPGKSVPDVRARLRFLSAFAFRTFCTFGALAFVSIPNILRASESLLSMQEHLARAGDYFGTPDGIMSKEMTRAIRRFQIRAGLPVTGELDEATMTGLEKERAQAAPSDRQHSPSVSESPPAPSLSIAAEGPHVSHAVVVPQPFLPQTSGDSRRSRTPFLPSGPDPNGNSSVVRPSGVTAREDPLAGSRFANAPPAVRAQIFTDAAAALTARRLLAPEAGGPVPNAAFFAALEEFQAVEGLPVTRTLDDPTLERLGLVPARPAPAAGPSAPRRLPSGNPARH